MNIIDFVHKTIIREGLICNGDKVLLAISGGIDSTTLLFVLKEIQKELPFNIGLAHINHQLRGTESERDEAFVKELAQRFSLPFHTAHLDVKKHASANGLSIQHAARELRYGAFDNIVNEYQYDRVAVAHNMDDQVETFLMRAIKGTGIRGLSSIPIKRDYIIRPFLNVSRNDIAAYAHSQDISFVEDSSNEKTDYERNYLRKKVLPLLEGLNPLFRDKICNLLNDISQVNGYFEEKARTFLEKGTKSATGEYVFTVKDLKKLDEETFFRVISNAAFSLEKSFIPLREHIKQIGQILSSDKPNLVSVLPHGIRVRKAYNRIFIEKTHPRQSLQEPIILKPGSNPVEPLGISISLSRSAKVPSPLPSGRNTAVLDADKVGILSLRTFRNGDRFVPLGLDNPVKLKDFFISAKVPRENRREIPLVLSNNDIIWVGGMRIDDRFKVTEKTKHIIKLRILKTSK